MQKSRPRRVDGIFFIYDYPFLLTALFCESGKYRCARFLSPILPFYRRNRGWRRVCRLASLYGGNCASETSRFPRRVNSIQYRLGHPARLCQQFYHCGLQSWRRGMAMDVRSRGNSRVFIPCRALSDSRESSMARHEESYRRSAQTLYPDHPRRQKPGSSTRHRPLYLP